jgi:hypothetical protein
MQRNHNKNSNDVIIINNTASIARDLGSVWGFLPVEVASEEAL